MRRIIGKLVFVVIVNVSVIKNVMFMFWVNNVRIIDKMDILIEVYCVVIICFFLVVVFLCRIWL